MKRIPKLVLWLVLSSLAAFGARANTAPMAEVQAANALICGTADQAKRFVTLHPDFQRALDTVNETGTDSNCLAAVIAYIPGKALDRVEQKDATYVVTEILIVGVGTPYGMLKVEPSVVYTVLKVNEETA